MWGMGYRFKHVATDGGPPDPPQLPTATDSYRQTI